MTHRARRIPFGRVRRRRRRSRSRRRRRGFDTMRSRAAIAMVVKGSGQ